MEWMRIIGDAVQYIEAHITEELTTDDIANAVCVSPFYFQRGFAMLCGTTVGEYIRCRRLALAGNALATTDARVIDIALRYGYDSPDSFTKAFTRFHGVTPTAVRQGALLKSYAPLKIKFSLEGGYLMDYKIEKSGVYRAGKCRSIQLRGRKGAGAAVLAGAFRRRQGRRGDGHIRHQHRRGDGQRNL